jgi:Na+-transporting NADH:ubiquinone oxidoreductase subunit C
MREKRWFPIVYMFLITALFSSVVIGLTEITRARVETNEKLAFERAILMVLPGLYDSNLSSLEMHRRFSEQVAEPSASSGGAYTDRQNGQIVAYALPMSGQGFWAPIRGIIGIGADKKTVTGIVFYQQNETPGLGAEIAKPAFQDQFKGKVLSGGEKPLRIRRPGEELGESDVHAVTGATQTSTRLERIVDAALKDWQSKVEGKGQD